MNKINDDIRKKIIYEVTVLGNKLKTVCDQLHINVSSAKNVLAIYRKEGRIEKKKFRVKRRKIAEQAEELVSQNQNQIWGHISRNEKSGISPIDIPTNHASQIGQIKQPNLNQNFGLNWTRSKSLILDKYCMCAYRQIFTEALNLRSMEEINLSLKTIHQSKNYTA